MKLLVSLVLIFSTLGVTSCQSNPLEEEQYSLTIDSVDSLRNAQLKKIELGVDMMKYSRSYYLKMDSILNDVTLVLERESSPKNKFLKDKKSWEKRRDIYFKEVKDEYDEMVESGTWGDDMYSTVYVNYAEFLYIRVVYLLTPR